jgi:hypothetical protein
LTDTQIRQPVREEGRPTTAFLLGFALSLLALAAVLALHGHADASGTSMLGIDMTSADNSPAGVDTCKEVNQGDSFDADVFVANVDQLVAFELRVSFDPSVLALDSADYNFLLTASGGGLYPINPQEENAGRWFIGAGEPSHGDSGSGTLARLHFHALASGTSDVAITSSPTILGPRMTSAGGIPFGDNNGDGIYDGTVTGGRVAVGRSCSGSTPIVTPAPGTIIPTPKPGTKTPAPTGHPASPTPRASGGPEPTDADNGGGGNDGSGGNSGNNGSNGSNGGGATAQAGGSTPVPSEFVGNIGGSDGNGSNGGSSAGEGSSSGNDVGANGPVTSNTGGGSSSLPYILIAAVLALAAVGGGTLLVIRSSSRR